ncbi:RNA polymerase sigma factor [Chitinophaga rhizophila]|uniref:RNA polymerase sigma factor n=1 Tax=Chitinophaga rhizophila TaxID=2866212 RepID=A0ABS7GG98_9BACT|nr:RNA polymerase sigma factor [Chitinophaga rhizophila]MBW8686436.1 RNA polymerase sigma factor [Chitinophaga rhizophila]
MSFSTFQAHLLENADFLMPVAMSLTKDAEAAKDLYQETLYKALKNKDKYVEGSNIRAWLYTIMRNLFINEYRRAAKFSTACEITPNITNNTLAEVNAENMLCTKEIKGTLYKLPVSFKKPLLLYCDGFKYHEIAEILHEPMGTIKSRIHLARKLLYTSMPRH